MSIKKWKSHANSYLVKNMLTVLSILAYICSVNVHGECRIATYFIPLEE